MIRLFGLTLLLTVLAACQSTAEPRSKSAPTKYDYKPIYFAGEKATPSEREKCEAVGVVLQNVGIMGKDICHQDLPDAGKICRDSDECLSECMAEESAMVGKRTTGQCSLYETNFGCSSRVENGRVEPVLCVD